MIIIEEGTVEPEAPPAEPSTWWIGETVTCDTCGCTAELEAGDSLSSRTFDGTTGMELAVGVACPTEGCGGMMNVSRV